MSEYQYYEFRAVDRPLTEEQMDELRSYSGRAEITPTSFTNVYNWGSFKGNPDKWMEKYFDAFLYMANWGSRRLIFRIPKRLLDYDTALWYCADETLDCRVKNDNLIISFSAEEAGLYDWVEGEGWLDRLIQLRSDLMHGDHRCLYLGWLRAVQEGAVDEDCFEPPVPPGLAPLNAPLQRLAEFLDIDPSLIAAAAERSEKEVDYSLSKRSVADWVAALPLKDKDSVLIRLIEGNDPHVAAELRQRSLSEIRGEAKDDAHGSSPNSERRTSGRLSHRAEAIAEEQEKREAERKTRELAEQERDRAEARKKRLESLVGKETNLWAEVDEMIAAKQPKQYDKAVCLLEDLRDLAVMTGTNSDFSQHMSALYEMHQRKPSLVRRFQKAMLLPLEETP